MFFETTLLKYFKVFLLTKSFQGARIQSLTFIVLLPLTTPILVHTPHPTLLQNLRPKSHVETQTRCFTINASTFDKLGFG